MYLYLIREPNRFEGTDSVAADDAENPFKGDCVTEAVA